MERLLGPAKPVADVLSSLDRQYKEQGKPAVYFLGPKEPIAPHLDELLRPNGDGLNAQGVPAFRRGAHADAVVLYEAALELMADQPAQAPAKLTDPHESCGGIARAGVGRTGCVTSSRSCCRNSTRPQSAESLMKGRARYHLALCQWRLGDRAAAQQSAEESLAAYDAAPKGRAGRSRPPSAVRRAARGLEGRARPRRRSPRSTHRPRSRPPAPAIEPARR